MERADIEHLAELSRLTFDEAELTTLAAELTDIVSYVGAVSDIAADEQDTAPVLGARHNVLRPDVVTNEPDQYTDALLAEMPQTHERQLKVPKILKTS